MLRVFQQPLEETILETESEEEEEIEQLSQEAGSYEEDFEERAEPRINLQGPYVNIWAALYTLSNLLWVNSVINPFAANFEERL